ncbi:hypothetical protein PtrSN002B_012335, partial [Pyrenophora tritici-repentis]
YLRLDRHRRPPAETRLLLRCTWPDLRRDSGKALVRGCRRHNFGQTRLPGYRRIKHPRMEPQESVIQATTNEGYSGDGFRIHGG